MIQYSVYKGGTSITFKTTWTNNGIDLTNPYVLCYLYQGSTQVLGPSSFTWHAGDDWTQQSSGSFLFTGNSGIFSASTSSDLYVDCTLPTVTSPTTYTFSAEFYARTGDLITTATTAVDVASLSDVNISGTAIIFAGTAFAFAGSIYALWRGLLWL